MEASLWPFSIGKKKRLWLTTLWINGESLTAALLIILNTFMDFTNKKRIEFSWQIWMGSVTDACSPSFFLSLCMCICMHVYIIACPEEGFLNTQLKAWKTEMKISENFFTEILPLIGSLTATFKKWIFKNNYLSKKVSSF